MTVSIRRSVGKLRKSCGRLWIRPNRFHVRDCFVLSKHEIICFDLEFFKVVFFDGLMFFFVSMMSGMVYLEIREFMVVYVDCSIIFFIKLICLFFSVTRNQSAYLNDPFQEHI